MANSELQAMLDEKARELFGVCDVEQKGFITKRDMQRLSGVLPLDPDQIESVFDMLDDDGNGYLTFEEFSGGFGAFMGISPGGDGGDGAGASASGGGGSGEADGEYIEEAATGGRRNGGGGGGRGRFGDNSSDDRDDYNVEEDEQFHHTMEKLGAAGVFEENLIREDSVKELWGKLQRDYPELVPGLESLLTKMTTEIQKSQDSYKSLEKVLRTKSSAHDDEVRKLYEEIEIQTEELQLPMDAGKEADAAGAERPSPEGAGDDDASSAAANAAGEVTIINKAPERIFKVVFVGDSGVGKSSIIHRFCQNSFKSTFSATIGIDFQIKAMCIEDQVIALQLWDTAGQERFRSITKQYFRKADGIVITYDVTNSVSYLHLREWMESVVEGAEDGAVKMVLGNKVDLIAAESEQEQQQQQNIVDTKSGTQLADEFDALFYEVSAKSGSTINEAFLAFASVLREKEDREMRNAIRISADIEKKKGCCGK